MKKFIVFRDVYHIFIPESVSLQTVSSKWFLFEYVKKEAKQLGCYEVTLNVWAGNTSAEKFYEKMGMRTKERQMEYIL